jgi:DNA-binding transcriptional LysR family regulator
MNWSRLDSLTMHQLRVFCAVARLLSYTRAAEELGCQQPTVSALVKELERVTQLTLFEQWGKRLALTDEGRELYAHAQQVVAAADEAWRTMAQLRGIATPESVPLRVAADTTVGTYVMPLKIDMVLGHIEAIKQAVAAGLGVSVLSEVAVKREVQYHKLVILPVEHFPIERRWYIARLAERPLMASTAAFIEFLREYKRHHE